MCLSSPAQHGTRPKLASAQKAQHLKGSCQENQEKAKPFLFKPEIQLQTLMSSACKSKLSVLFFNTTIQCRNCGRHGASWGQMTHKHRRTHADRHPYPLSVSWPRRRTRCTSLWSTAPVKRLAWYAPSPVWLQVTWTTDTDSAAHPSSTWARFPDAIGRPGYPPFQRLAVWFSNCQINQGRAEKSGPGSGPSPGVDCRRTAEERKWTISKHMEHTPIRKKGMNLL